eukprot:NODE_7306_length_487_cov_14.837900_g6864_i0.p1 GENE.NODE_7306_length_487_cov_14.837900_g6864_i0~~NODE_7306_length_487_cov_14.837900_g6864_i0.p1  ORF type:complete len:101 (+),score=6.32 NODE_7306_length_487_cov_14.837900_g6864_i0:68-370(+)
MHLGRYRNQENPAESSVLALPFFTQQRGAKHDIGSHSPSRPARNVANMLYMLLFGELHALFRRIPGSGPADRRWLAFPGRGGIVAASSSLLLPACKPIRH